MSQWIAVFLKGVAMGAADVVPGVSGGTIAFISGIYQRLLDAIKSVNPFALKILFQQGVSAFWRSIDGTFLCVLFAGIVTSLVSLARLISYSLDNQPILVWSFFFGLVLASIIYILRQLSSWRWQEVAALIIGTSMALFVSVATPASLPAQWWMLMLAGAIAICAMILPGISGSFILLLMGMYSVFIDALKNLDILLLGSFAVGCAIGLMLFSHLLSWLLHHYKGPMLALLTGFLIGSLNVIWPWKQVISTMVDRHGDIVPMVQKNVLPIQFEVITGTPHQLLLSIILMVCGIILVLGLEKIGDKKALSE